MKRASDFKVIAKNALTGRWGLAVGAGALASLLGGVSGGSGFGSGGSSGSSGTDTGGNPFGQLLEGNEQLAGIFLGVAVAILILALSVAVAYFIVGSVVSVGYSQFNLDLVDGQKAPKIPTLFGHFKNWKTTAAASFLQSLYIALWSLLFLIPGIIATYSYAMTKYILAEHPELTASEAIDRSKEMMYGNRWRLFCLQWSFVGWGLLCLLTCGVGFLWLTPYQEAATAAFYREVSGTEYLVTADAVVPEQTNGMNAAW